VRGNCKHFEKLDANVLPTIEYCTITSIESTLYSVVDPNITVTIPNISRKFDIAIWIQIVKVTAISFVLLTLQRVVGSPNADAISNRTVKFSIAALI